MRIMGNPKPVPEGYHTLSPHLVVHNCPAALEFYAKGLGARELRRHAEPGGRILHAEMQIGDSRFFLNDEFPEMGAKGPLSLGGTPVTLHLFVEDCDKLFQQAVSAGAKVAMPLADQFWGDRYGIVTDPFGHNWSIASHVKDISPAELEAATAEVMKSMAEDK
jgi:uncharacterized glyoxalase superfamily protein PhnB